MSIEDMAKRIADAWKPEPISVKRHPAKMSGVQKLYAWENGYGASVIRTPFSFGGREGYWELAVLHGNGICYSTPIANDVIGWLDKDEVDALLRRIAALNPNGACTHVPAQEGTK